MLKSKIYREGGKTWRLIDFINKAKHTVFGLIFPSETEQQGQGVKILTPKQMIIRFPILLAQLKAVNNSEKLKRNKTNSILFVQIKKPKQNNL